jgi:hypothetical protein
MKVKSVSQLRIVFPEPAKATTMRDRVGSRATKPFIFAVVVSFLVCGKHLLIYEVREALTSLQTQLGISHCRLRPEDRRQMDR